MPLNEVCNADTPVARNRHKHKCRQCATVWQHSDDVQNSTSEEFDEAHTCPGCGAEDQTRKIMDEQEKEKALEAFETDPFSFLLRGLR